MTTEDWNMARDLPIEGIEADWPAELISQSVLIQLTDKVWINPQHVVSVRQDTSTEFRGKDPGQTVVCVFIQTSDGRSHLCDGSLAEVVALING